MSEGGEGINFTIEKETEDETSGHFNEALKDLRNRDIKSIAMRDGNVLIQAEILDLQEHQEPNNSEELQHLRELDSALLELGYDDENELDYETAKKLRSYFRGKKVPLDTQIENYGDTDPQLIANRNIYAAILKEINKGLPTLEAALPEFPKYNFSEAISSGRIELPTNTSLSIEDIKIFYEALGKDISTARTANEISHPDWVKQKNLIAVANEKWIETKPDERKPLLITKKPDGTGEVKIYDPTETHIDKNTQYIVDPEEDMEYLLNVEEFDRLEFDAKEAVVGLEKLQVGTQPLSFSELSGIVLFLARLEKGVANGELGRQYRKPVEELEIILKEKLESAMLEKGSLQPAFA